MSAICQTASGFARWFTAPIAFQLPSGPGAGLPALRPVATARLREFINTLLGTQKKRPNRGGDPGERPETLALRSYWDDPALWMLMMH